MNPSFALDMAPAIPAAPLETRTNRAFAFGLGVLLVVLTFRTQYIGTPTDLISRIAPVDFLCALFLAVLFLRHRMRPLPWPSIPYVAAVVLALVPGLLITPGPEMEVWVQFSAILMAFGFYVVGLNIGASPVLLRWVMAGLCIAVLAEAVVVYHDSLASSMWFPDPMEHRVRGTFKTNGQLGAFGFCAGVFLVTFGMAARSPAFRVICIASAVLAASFVFPASRRMGMLSVFAWGVLFAVLAWRFARNRFYQAFVGGFLALLVLLAVFWPQVEASFAGRRFRDAVVVTGSRRDFIQEQLRDSLKTSDQWFPLGFGAGRGYRIDPEEGFEVHNCFLAVLVELGVLGLVGYLGMLVHPMLRRRWQQRSREHQLLGVLLTTSMVIGYLFMFHNTLYRDRTFLLFLGVATTVVLRESNPRISTGLLGSPVQEKGNPRISWSGA